MTFSLEVTLYSYTHFLNNRLLPLFPSHSFWTLYLHCVLYYLIVTGIHVHVLMTNAVVAMVEPGSIVVLHTLFSLR